MTRLRQKGETMNFTAGMTYILKNSGSKEYQHPKKIRKEFRLMKEKLAVNSVTIVLQALMANPHVEEIDWHSSATPTDDELNTVIRAAQDEGLSIILKPMVNCRNGTWRGYISFIDPPVEPEPKWSGWFRNYTEYMLHYADIAETTGCEMLLLGCEFVLAQGQEQYWRKLVLDVREHYHGLLSFNVDKYQEDRLTWWDAVDVISSSGYYPSGTWKENLDRIEAVVKKYGKPFYFAECGCPAQKGASSRPNDWTVSTPASEREQVLYYDEMMRECMKRPWCGGFACWAWVMSEYKHPKRVGSYSVCGRKTENVIRKAYRKAEEDGRTLNG